MIDDKKIEYYKQTYFCNGEPVKYTLSKGHIVQGNDDTETAEKGEIEIYPIMLKDAQSFLWCEDIININKNAINDINAITSTYLDYLLTTIIPKENVKLSDNVMATQLYRLLKLVLKGEIEQGFNIMFYMDEQYTICRDYKTKKPVIALVKLNDDTKQIVELKEINEKEFDDICKIIKFQNDPYYIDRYVSPDVQKMVDDYYRLKNKNDKTEQPSLEKQKAFVTSKTGLTLSQLNEFTYRYFIEVYQSCLNSELYIGQKIIQGSFKYDIKEDIVHPMFEPQKDPIAEAFGGDVTSFENKINNINN